MTKNKDKKKRESFQELERVRFQDMDQLLEDGVILRFSDVKGYQGTFTGKMVKPLDGESLEDFQRGDPVYVFHLEDYLKFYAGTLLMWKAFQNEVKDITRKYDHEGL